MADPRRRFNGFSIRSWSDLLALLAIVSLIFSAFMWVSSLQQGKEDHERRITRLEAEK